MPSPAPLPASRHTVFTRRGSVDAVTMLTIYLVLLLAFPSSMGVAALGSFGRPQFLWGFVLLLWWMLTHLQARDFAVRPVSQPAMLALGALVVVWLLSYAAAMLRGQPADQITPALSAVARLLSWSGVFLVAVDGIRTMTDFVRLTNRLVIGGTLLAILGIAQFLTKQPLIDFLGAIPGFSGSATGLADRGGFIRSSATAAHPLEYATVLSACLPLAVAAAIAVRSAARHYWWISVGLLSLACFLAVSRSAIIGFAVAVAALIPALPRVSRLVVVSGAAAILLIASVTVRGLFGTIVGMFEGIVNGDSSTTSRSDALALVPFFLSDSPVLGSGLGTFLPRYYIFDNQWAQVTVETGVAGLLVFLAFVLTAIASAFTASKVSGQEDARLYGRVLAASVFTVAVIFLFFDGLAFPMAGGLLFLLTGLCGAIRSIGHADAELYRVGVALSGAGQIGDAPPAYLVPRPASAPRAVRR